MTPVTSHKDTRMATATRPPMRRFVAGSLTPCPRGKVAGSIPSGAREGRHAGRRSGRPGRSHRHFGRLGVAGAIYPRLGADESGFESRYGGVCFWFLCLINVRRPCREEAFAALGPRQVA